MSNAGKVSISQKPAYPRGAYFCLLNEFAERYASLGVQAVLTFYLLARFGLSRSEATVAYHAIVCFSYFTSIVGSIWADGFSGPYKVILYTSSAYCFGPFLLTLSAMPNPVINDQLLKAAGILGLFITAFCCGGRRPCSTAFAANQFPDCMVVERKRFFSTLYLLTYLSGIATQTATPFFRGGISCLGQKTCYPMAFGACFVSVVTALVIFLLGRSSYVGVSPEQFGTKRENVIAKAIKCISFGIKNKFGRKGRRGDKANDVNCAEASAKNVCQGNTDWLDAATSQFGQKFVSDVRGALRACSMLTPTVIFWALYFQICSTFVIQGSTMNTRVGRATILPDQMIMLSSIFAVLLIIVLDYCVYPALDKRHMSCTSLQRLGVGCCLGVICFTIAGFIQLELDSTADLKPPVDHSKYSLLNLADHVVRFETPEGSTEIGLNQFENIFISTNKNTTHYKYRYANSTIDKSVDTTHGNKTSESSLTERNNVGKLIVFWGQKMDLDTSVINYRLQKTEHGGSTWHIIFQEALKHSRDLSVIFRSEQDESIQFVSDAYTTPYVELTPPMMGSDVFNVFLKSCEKLSDATNNKTNNDEACNLTLIYRYTALSGAAHALLIKWDWSIYNVTLVSANQISLMWQIPQYLLLSAGDMIVSIAGVEFAYVEAAPTMKSILQAYRLITCTLGNVLDMAVSSCGLFTNPALEFFFWAILMLITLIIHVLMSLQYRYASDHHRREDTRSDRTKKDGCASLENKTDSTRL